MKKINLTFGRYVEIVICALLLFVCISYAIPMSGARAKILAEGVFPSVAKRMKMTPDEFELVSEPSPERNFKHQYVGFVWRGKSKPECIIEVDVDLIYANARPRGDCNGLK